MSAEIIEFDPLAVAGDEMFYQDGAWRGVTIPHPDTAHRRKLHGENATYWSGKASDAIEKGIANPIIKPLDQEFEPPAEKPEVGQVVKMKRADGKPIKTERPKEDD